MIWWFMVEKKQHFEKHDVSTDTKHVRMENPESGLCAALRFKTKSSKPEVYRYACTGRPHIVPVPSRDEQHFSRSDDCMRELCFWEHAVLLKIRCLHTYVTHIALRVTHAPLLVMP